MSWPSSGGAIVPRVAVIGTGYWGINLVRTFSTQGALVGVCDQNAALAERAAAEFDVPVRAWSDLLADDSVDAVAVATPAASHAALAIEALRAGKHVFVEKPLALEVPDAERVREVARASDRTLMVGHLLRYHPAFLALQDLAHAGELGQIRYLYSNRLNFGRFRSVENILWSFTPHDISMILALVGEEPDEVSAIGAAYLNRAISDVTTTHLSFPSGAAAHIFVSWLHPYKEQKLVVVGDRGMAVFDDVLPWEAKLQLYAHEVAWRGGVPEPARAEAIAVPLEPREPLSAECAHFLDCVRSGDRPVTDVDEAIRVLRVLHRADRSRHEAASAPPAPPAPAAAPGAYVHPSAVVDDDVRIGPGTRVWHFVHLLPGTSIGAECTLGQNVMIGPDVAVGDRCRVQNNVSLYNGVNLEDDVFIGPSAVFTNVKNPRSEVERKSEFLPTTVRRGATIGANATIVCGNELGAYCMVAAGAVVTADVPAHTLVAGVPARSIGWVSRHGERLGEDLRCPATGEQYRADGAGGVELVRND